MSVLKYQVATCSYTAYRPKMGLPIRASLGGPRWWKGGIPKHQVMLEIAPGRSYFNEESDQVFERMFRAQLDGFGVEYLIGRFNLIGETVGLQYGSVLVPMCFEKLTSWDDKKCHRAMFRHWWLEQTGEILNELGLPPDTPPPVVEDMLPLDL